MTPSAEEIAQVAMQAVFGRPLVTNVHRGILVEAIVSRSLGNAWTWCAADYASWDFEHQDGTRLEVKQSAARQSWSTTSTPAVSWDIAPRKGAWQGSMWRADVRRNAQIYVFAHHPVADDTADHRDPRQWWFFVVEERLLPQTKRLTLARAAVLGDPVNFEGLAGKVHQVHSAANAPSREP